MCPFGPERDDQRAGMIVATLININKDRKSKPTTWRDAMPIAKYDKDTGYKNLLTKVIGLNQLYGGTDNRSSLAKAELLEES